MPEAQHWDMNLMEAKHFIKEPNLISKLPGIFIITDVKKIIIEKI